VIRAAWIVVAIVFVARALAAFSVPITGDEAYYWEWSKRLAFGYVDHPPAVAWTIHLFAQFGHGAGLVRLGFVVCGVVATLAMASCATVLANDARAGAVAALAFSLTPLATLAFASATPDGPFLMFWCLSLWFAARAFRYDGTLDFALLGVALGGALLSRIFGFALLAGVLAYALTPNERWSWRRGFWLSLVVAALVYAPFVVWNAQHGWVTFAFSLLHRHEGEGGAGFSLRRLLQLYGALALAYSPGIWLAALVCAVRPRSALLGWTGVPLLAFLTLFALFRQVEIAWFFGAFASLCTMLGIAYVQAADRARTAWSVAAVVPAAVLLFAVFAVTYAPGPIYESLRRATGVTLRNSGPFEIFAVAPLASDVSRLAREREAIVMTDGYGLSSALDFDAGIPPVVIGYDWQGRESRAWYPSTMLAQRGLFVDKEPLATRPDFQAHLARACSRVVDGAAHAYRFGSAPARTFYFTWCEGMKPDGIAILRWEREPQ
jgi:4-amino-4-deoxy-L-arabinose transferase-like glycosyltransferase